MTKCVHESCDIYYNKRKKIMSGIMWHLFPCLIVIFAQSAICDKKMESIVVKANDCTSQNIKVGYT